MLSKALEPLMQIKNRINLNLLLCLNYLNFIIYFVIYGIFLISKKLILTLE